MRPLPPATAEADVLIERGPSPAPFRALGLGALAICAVIAASAFYQFDQLRDRAVPVEAAVVGGFINFEENHVDAEVRFEYAGEVHTGSVRLCDCTDAPKSVVLMIDPDDPQQFWLRGNSTPWPVRYLTALAVLFMLAPHALVFACRLRKRRQRLDLVEAVETRRCTVLANAVAEVGEIPDEFVIGRPKLGLIYYVWLFIIGSVLLGFGIAWLTMSAPMAVAGAALVATVLFSIEGLRRSRRERIVVSKDGVCVRTLCGDREFSWAEITSATVVRRQPWRLGMSDQKSGREIESVIIKAELIGFDGTRVPTRLARRRSVGESSGEKVSPSDAAERLVGAWEKRRRRPSWESTRLRELTAQEPYRDGFGGPSTAASRRSSPFR